MSESNETKDIHPAEDGTTWVCTSGIDQGTYIRKDGRWIKEEVGEN